MFAKNADRGGKVTMQANQAANPENVPDRRTALP